MEITPEMRKRVKGKGFLSNRDGEHFSARVLTENGVMTSEQFKALAVAAERFGNGRIALTARMTLELPGVAYQDIEPIQAFMQKAGMEIGGTGAKVRPVVACKGSVCTFGLADTQALGTELHRRFYKGYGKVALPHKFKIAVGGCPNSCVKPDLNDIGLVGQRPPQFIADKCKGCGKCGVAAACPVGAATVREGKLVIDRETCNNCGRCEGNCPFGALQAGESLLRVYVGGRWGKQVRHGTPLTPLFTPEQALDIVEKAILLFKEQGKEGERFGQMVDRLGIEQTERQLLDGGLLARKARILGEDGPC